MKKTLVLWLLISVSFRVFPQKYDLIVTARGDSIACHIDSISQETIYFRMLYNGQWTPTFLDRDEVVTCEDDVINKRAYEFRPNTSYILGQLKEAHSFRSIPRNSFYAGILTVNYSTLIPFKRSGINLAVGLSFLNKNETSLQTEVTYLLNGPMHFFEPGLMWFHNSTDDFLLIRTGYRFQGKKGLLCRVSPLLVFFEGSINVLPSLSLGISF